MYRGDGFTGAGLTTVAEAGGGCSSGLGTHLEFNAAAGTYSIAVAGRDSSAGTFILHWIVHPGATLSIGNAYVVEGDGGTTTMALPVRLSESRSSANHGRLRNG